MPHSHRWPDGRPPGIYCSGTLRNGEKCRQMLASQVGAGLWMIVRDRLVATVPAVHSIRCPICLTDNAVTPLAYQEAIIEPLTELTAASNVIQLSGIYRITNAATG